MYLKTAATITGSTGPMTGETDMQHRAGAIGRWLSIALLGAFLSACAPQVVREDAGGAWTETAPAAASP
jgi:hypothetical protein